MKTTLDLPRQPKIRSVIMTGMKLSTQLHLPRKGPGSYKRAVVKRTSLGW